ncbi:hypothetical protein ACWCQL_35040 [Streptomyces sp. NPDC002073]
MNSIKKAAATVATAAVIAVTAGCGDGSGTGAPPSAPAASTKAPTAGQDPLGREAVDRDVDEATAEAGLMGLSPGVDPDETDPTEIRLGRCTTLWAGSPGGPLDTQTGERPYSDALAALEERGWKRTGREQHGDTALTTFTKKDWNIRATLKESDRVDLIQFAAFHESCRAEVFALAEKRRTTGTAG